MSAVEAAGVRRRAMSSDRWGEAEVYCKRVFSRHNKLTISTSMTLLSPTFFVLNILIPSGTGVRVTRRTQRSGDVTPEARGPRLASGGRGRSAS